MTDLFRSKKDMILDYIRERKWVRTSDVIKYASSIHSNRGDRDARKLAEEGKIKRMSEEEKLFRFGGTKEDVWMII